MFDCFSKLLNFTFSRRNLCTLEQNSYASTCLNNYVTVLNLNLNKMHQNIKIKFYRKLSLLNISRFASIVHHHTLTIVILFRTCNYKGPLLLKMFASWYWTFMTIRNCRIDFAVYHNTSYCTHFRKKTYTELRLQNYAQTNE